MRRPAVKVVLPFILPPLRPQGGGMWNEHFLDTTQHDTPKSYLEIHTTSQTAWLQANYRLLPPISCSGRTELAGWRINYHRKQGLCQTLCLMVAVVVLLYITLLVVDLNRWFCMFVFLYL